LLKELPMKTRGFSFLLPKAKYPTLLFSNFLW